MTLSMIRMLPEVGQRIHFFQKVIGGELDYFN